MNLKRLRAGAARLGRAAIVVAIPAILFVLITLDTRMTSTSVSEQPSQMTQDKVRDRHHFDEPSSARQMTAGRTRGAQLGPSLR